MAGEYLRIKVTPTEVDTDTVVRKPLFGYLACTSGITKSTKFACGPYEQGQNQIKKLGGWFA